jgi:hypothetical protein
VTLPFWIWNCRISLLIEKLYFKHQWRRMLKNMLCTYIETLYIIWIHTRFQSFTWRGGRQQGRVQVFDASFFSTGTDEGFFRETEFCSQIRVTRLGEFSPNGRLLSLGSYFENGRSSSNFVLSFSRRKVFIHFDKKCSGQHFGRFFHKLIWSPWQSSCVHTSDRSPWKRESS